MADILQTIADATRIRVQEEEARIPLRALQGRAEHMESSCHSFARALQRPGLSFICEVKKASPSKGVIDPQFDYLHIAHQYQKAGADCISCLTEPQWFKGSNEIFSDIRALVNTPMIRKDFTISEYQIYQSKCMGAQAVLLICALLDTSTLARYIQLTHELGMDALVETHDAEEIRQAVDVGATIIGVNNRNLKDFSVDFDNAQKLRSLIPPDCVYVAESGVSSAEDVAALSAMEADAALIGEALMRAEDKTATLAQFRAAAAAQQKACRQVRDTRVKLCGMQRPEDIAAVNQAHPHYCGFIVNYPQSHRSVSAAQAQQLAQQLNDDITPVAVVVDQPVQDVATLVNEGIITTVQLHGAEDENYVAQLRQLTCDITIIKACEVRTAADVAHACTFPADVLLLDSGKGSGESFDWSITAAATRPFILAGGLNVHNLHQAIKQVHPWGIDLSSGLETNGAKDAAKILEISRAYKEDFND